jgi:hypothetical protein
MALAIAGGHRDAGASGLAHRMSWKYLDEVFDIHGPSLAV